MKLDEKGKNNQLEVITVALPKLSYKERRKTLNNLFSQLSCFLHLK